MTLSLRAHPFDLGWASVLMCLVVCGCSQRPDELYSGHEPRIGDHELIRDLVQRVKEGQIDELDSTSAVIDKESKDRYEVRVLQAYAESLSDYRTLLIVVSMKGQFDEDMLTGPMDEVEGLSVGSLGLRMDVPLSWRHDQDALVDMLTGVKPRGIIRQWIYEDEGVQVVFDWGDIIRRSAR